MDVHHFRPACKIIKRSRNNKGPFFTSYDDDDLTKIFTDPDRYLDKGEVNLRSFRIKKAVYSRKLFLGGLPKGIKEEILLKTFSKFGAATIDWPYKKEQNKDAPKEGYAFLIFEENETVEKVLNACTERNCGYYLSIPLSRKKSKVVQVIPWKLSGTDYVYLPYLNELDVRNTVFVGGMDRTVCAKQLALIMKCHFGDVSYAGIDIDPEYSYPKGAARVTFISRESMVAAIKVRFLMPLTTNTKKMMEIKPYVLDNQNCDNCNSENAGLFCPDLECLLYFCEMCWPVQHNFEQFSQHKPLVKQGIQDYNNSAKKKALTA